MNVVQKSALALSLLGAVSFAQAGLASITITFEEAGTYESNFSGASTIDFEGSTACPSAYTCSGDYQVRENTDNVVRGSAPPAGATPLGEYWLTVPNPKSNGTAEFTLSNDYDYFGMFWGSIDTYNFISFKKDGELVSNVISGADLIPQLEANGNQQNATSNRFVNFFFDNGSYDTVVLSSTRLAFETDNHAFGNQFQTVEASSPSVFALLGLGLIGLAWGKRKQK